MKLMKELIDRNTPFAVMYYHVTAFEETCYEYEMMYLSEDGDQRFKSLCDADINYFKSIKDKFSTPVKMISGKIYDFNNYRSYFKENADQTSRKLIKQL